MAEAPSPRKTLGNRQPRLFQIYSRTGETCLHKGERLARSPEEALALWLAMDAGWDLQELRIEPAQADTSDWRFRVSRDGEPDCYYRVNLG